MKRWCLIFFSVFSHVVLSSQNDSINKVDDAGLKQGYWIVTAAMKPKPNYADNQKVEEGRFLDSKKQGVWQEFYPNGNLKSKITFEGNRPSGNATMYREDGSIIEQGLWKNNRWVGSYKLYHENGKVSQEFTFNTSGKREGVQKYYYPNGQLMMEGNWADGKESGVIKEYYENGDLKSEKNFNEGNVDMASIKTFESKKGNATVVKKEEVVEKPDNTSSTTVSKIEEKPNLPNAVFNGEGKWTLYNKNKQISKDGIFSKGRLVDGKVYDYSDDGILIRIAIYKDSKYVGEGVVEK